VTGVGERFARWLVLSFRLHRWEVTASVAGSALLVVAMLILTSQMRSMAAAHPECPDPASYLPGCEQFSQSFQGLADWASQALRVAWAAPFGMGLVLGVPLVAREVEQGTAAVAWTLSRSRVLWLARRVAFLLLVLVGLLLIIGLAAEVMAAAIAPTLRLDSDFTWYGRRGVLIAARGIASLGLGVVIGAMVGRLLPAMLVAAFASVLLFGAVTFGMDRWLEADAEVVPAMNGGIGSDPGGALLLGTRIELPSGELATWDSLFQRGFNDIYEDMDGRIYTNEEDVGHHELAIGVDRQLVIRGHLYPAILLRESAVVAGIGGVLGLLAALVVRRRRPA
jgi:ABC-type transport system involved in multi-copper enzyme maturation permease subunit